MKLRTASARDAKPIADLHVDSWRRHYRGAFRDSFLDGDVFAERLAVWVGAPRRPGSGAFSRCSGGRSANFVNIVPFVLNVRNVLYIPYLLLAIVPSDSVRGGALPHEVMLISLRKSSCLTPGSLIAGRANALKSTGPRTERGKARVVLNASRRAVALREHLAQAGYREGEALYCRIRSRLLKTPCPGIPTATRTVWPTGFGCLSGSGAALSRY
jgi:hypothetical protein